MTVATIVADAIAHQVRMAALDVALDEADRRFSPIDDAQVTAAEAALVKAAKRGTNRGRKRFYEPKRCEARLPLGATARCRRRGGWWHRGLGRSSGHAKVVRP